jgi:hypothetical protein
MNSALRFAALIHEPPVAYSQFEIKKGNKMSKTYDRRFLGMLGFLGFRGFLGSENDHHLARFAGVATLAIVAVLVFLPRQVSRVNPRHRLDRPSDILSVLAEKK